MTSRLAPRLSMQKREGIRAFGGAEGSRTPDLLSAIHSTEILADPRGNTGENERRGWLPSLLAVLVK